jgi:hypothetical protein
MNNSLKQLPHKKHFHSKLIRSGLIAFCLITFSLLIGSFGYMYFFRISFVDGFYNASLILTGMGPVDPAPSNAAKIFASFYAIYSGVAFLTTAAVILAPVLHRFLHKFHLDIEE